MRAEDEDLIARFLQGEHEAAAVLQGWVAQAARPFKRRLDIQWPDVLQEVHLEVIRLLRKGAFRGEANLKTYIWRVANHTCINHLRAQMKPRWVALDPVVEQSRSPEGSPLDCLLEKESDQVLLHVLEEMDAECRTLWSMILEGLSYQEMSQRLGVPDGTLRVRALRCRKKAIAIRNRWLRRKA